MFSRNMSFEQSTDFFFPHANCLLNWKGERKDHFWVKCLACHEKSKTA